LHLKLFKLGNVYIELEEEFECINKEHINSVLNKYIRENECVNKSYYDNKQEISLTDNDNINQQNKLTLYKSTPFIEEIDKDIKNIKNDNNVILTNKTDNINTDKNKKVILTDKIDNINTLKEPVKEPVKEIKPPTTSGIVKEIKPPTTSGIVKEPVKEIKPPTTSGIVDKLNGLMNIQPPTINNIKTIDIENKNDDDELEQYKQKYLYSINYDINSIKSLASSVIKSNRNNKTIKVDMTPHKKTLKKRDFPKA
jgi:hypothetical protein